MQIEQRVEEQIAYFNKKSGVCKKWYYIFTCITTVGSIFVTALIQYDKFWASIISLIVASSAAFNNILNFSSKWKLYRTTAEKLEREQSFFDNQVECYKNQSLSLYARNIEAILSDSNSTWTNTIFKKEKEEKKEE